MRLRLLAAVSILVSILVACSGSPADESVPPPAEESNPAPEAAAEVPTGTRQDPYVGHGTIRAIQAEQHQVLIQHDDIPGFMTAMMMVFPVDPATSIENFETGDAVMFSVEKVGDNQYQIFDIQREGTQ